MQHGSTMQWNGSTDGSSITNDTWYHLVITQNGTSPKFWVGALGSAITDQTNLSTTTAVTKWFEASWNSFEIGVNQAHSGGRLDGGIAEFACWNTVLTDSQISDLHNASGNGVSASTISAGLRFLFNFDVNGEADNKALAGTTYTSDLPTGTRYEETDTRKIYRLTSSSGWKEKGVA